MGAPDDTIVLGVEKIKASQRRIFCLFVFYVGRAGKHKGGHTGAGQPDSCVLG